MSYPRAEALRLELQTDPALAVAVFYGIRIGMAWTGLGEIEFTRSSLTYTGEVDSWGHELPIARVVRLEDATWRAGISPERLEESPAYPSSGAAMFAEDQRLAAAGWSLAAPVAEEDSW